MRRIKFIAALVAAAAVIPAAGVDGSSVGLPPAVGQGAQMEDEPARRAEVAELLTALDARVATIAAQRECAPRGDLLNVAGLIAGLIRASMDPPLSRVEARRLVKSLVELKKLAELYDREAENLCKHEAERVSAESARVRTVAEEHLMRAATAIQSRMPSSAAELDPVLSFKNRCYRPSAYVNSTMIAVHERARGRRGYTYAKDTPFQALKRFVHVADDGVIRARRNGRVGADVLDYYNAFTSTIFGIRNHTYLAAHAQGSGFTFRLCIKRRGLKPWNWILASGKYIASQGLTDLPESPTIADIVIGRLVRDARRFAAASCASTVQSGARLARVFEASTPSDADAARLYADAARWMRTEIESQAATGAADICRGRNADFRALAGPAVEAAAGVTDPSAAERALFRAERALREHARRISEEFLFGERHEASPR